MSLLDALSQPLFKAYQKAQPFNENHLRPCAMLENPKSLVKIVDSVKAKSPDLESPEGACHLCGKCESYAENWAPVAERLRKENPKQKLKPKGQLPDA